MSDLRCIFDPFDLHCPECGGRLGNEWSIAARSVGTFHVDLPGMRHVRLTCVHGHLVMNAMLPDGALIEIKKTRPGTPLHMQFGVIRDAEIPDNEGHIHPPHHFCGSNCPKHRPTELGSIGTLGDLILADADNRDDDSGGGRTEASPPTTRTMSRWTWRDAWVDVWNRLKRDLRRLRG
jgi:hypothetical protein